MESINSLNLQYNLLTEAYNLMANDVESINESTGLLNESAGEKLKAIGAKVLEVIKKIIEKIKELIQKIKDFINEIKEEKNNIAAKYYDIIYSVSSYGDGYYNTNSVFSSNVEVRRLILIYAEDDYDRDEFRHKETDVYKSINDCTKETDDLSYNDAIANLNCMENALHLTGYLANKVYHKLNNSTEKYNKLLDDRLANNTSETEDETSAFSIAYDGRSVTMHIGKILGMCSQNITFFKACVAGIKSQILKDIKIGETHWASDGSKETANTVKNKFKKDAK